MTREGGCIWFLRTMAGIIAVSFTVAATLDAQWNMKSSIIMMYGTAGIALAGPAFLICAHEAWRRSAFAWAVVLLLISQPLMFISMTISLGGVATLKDALRSTRETAQANAVLDRNRRQDVTEEIAAMRAVTGGETPDMVKPTIAKLEPLCERGAPKACAKLADAQRKLAAAERIAELEARQGAWPTTLTDAPTSAEPGIENLTVMGKDLGIAIPEQSLRAGLNAAWVVALELIGNFGPLAAFAWGRERPARARRKWWGGAVPALPIPQPAMTAWTPTADVAVQTPVPAAGSWAYLARPAEGVTLENSIAGNALPVSRSPVIAEGVAAPLTVSRDTRELRRMKTPQGPSLRTNTPQASLNDIAQWAEDRLDRHTGGKIQAQPLFANYTAWCMGRGKPPVTQYAFGLTLKELGWRKEKISGRIFYLDIAIRASATGGCAGAEPGMKWAGMTQIRPPSGGRSVSGHLAASWVALAQCDPGAGIQRGWLPDCAHCAAPRLRM